MRIGLLQLGSYGAGSEHPRGTTSFRIPIIQLLVAARDIEACIGSARVLNQQQYCWPRLGCTCDNDLGRALIANMQVSP